MVRDLRRLYIVVILAISFPEGREGAGIPRMRVTNQPIRLTGCWEYLSGSWGEATPLKIAIFINIKTETNKKLRYVFY